MAAFGLGAGAAWFLCTQEMETYKSFAVKKHLWHGASSSHTQQSFWSSGQVELQALTKGSTWSTQLAFRLAVLLLHPCE